MREIAEARGGARDGDAARVVDHDRIGSHREVQQTRGREEHVGAEGLEVDLLAEDRPRPPEASELELPRR